MNSYAFSSTIRSLGCTLTMLFLSFLLLTSVSAQDVDEPPVIANTYFDLPTYEQRWTFRELAGERVLRVDGMADQMSLGFGSRMDQIPQGGTLYLNYVYSPTLVGRTSQLRIRFNGELIRAITLPVDAADRRHELELNLPANYFSRYNELTFELLAEAEGLECAVLSPAAWLEFSSQSYIEIATQQLVVADELSWFPEPFFDQRDFTRPSFHYVLPEQTSHNHLNAAGILHSFFAKQAAWRGTEAQVYRYRQSRLHEVEDWPQSHAIVFMTNDERPWLFRDYHDVNEPTVRIITNPLNDIFKVLLIQAPDTDGLIAAVHGLVEHRAGLSGDRAIVHAAAPEPRPAYSAPRWVRTDRPVTFSELVDFPGDLQRNGYANAPIAVNLMLPPDLFTWQRHGIPIDLKFRHTPPIEKDESRLRVFINNEFIKGYTLTESGVGGAADRIRVPLLEFNPFTQPALQIPAFKLGAVNRLDFEFTFSARSEECRVRPLGNTTGAIDGDSSIDLRGYEHYVEMPNLHLFAKTGYPFSRYDDLYQTLVVMDIEPSNTDIEVMLSAIALIAGATGHHTSGLNVVAVDEIAQTSSKDALIIGRTALQAFLQRFGRATLDQQLAHHGLSGRQQLLFSNNEQVTVSGPSAAMVSFQSPLHSRGTVVALTATDSDYLGQISALLRSSERSSAVTGFMTILTPGHEQNLQSFSRYYVGELSFWKRLYFHLSRYPVLVSVITLLALITLVLVIYWLFARKARRRVGGQ